MKIQQTAAATVIAMAALLGTAANAATPIPGLFNTDASLAPDGATDPHWTVNGGTPVVYNNAAYLTDPSARFIAAQAGGGYSINPNTYELTFSLAGFNPSTASLSGSFASDNWADAYLNGILLAQQPHATTTTNFQTLTSFSAPSADFVSGLNRLDFIVTDTGAPSALLVTGLSGAASLTSAVPEPATWTMMLLGFGSIGYLLRGSRRKQSGAAATA